MITLLASPARINLGLEAGIPLEFSFPKTAKGTDLMTSSPSTVSPKQLRELCIDVKVKKPEAPVASSTPKA